MKKSTSLQDGQHAPTMKRNLTARNLIVHVVIYFEICFGSEELSGKKSRINTNPVPNKDCQFV